MTVEPKSLKNVMEGGSRLPNLADPNINLSGSGTAFLTTLLSLVEPALALEGRNVEGMAVLPLC